MANNDTSIYCTAMFLNVASHDVMLEPSLSWGLCSKSVNLSFALYFNFKLRIKNHHWRHFKSMEYD